MIFKKDGKLMGRPSAKAPRMYFKEDNEARAEIGESILFYFLSTTFI